MKTEYEQIILAIEWGDNNPNVKQSEIDKEKVKLKICNKIKIRVNY